MEHNDLLLPDSLEEDARQVQRSLTDGAQAGLDLASALEKARKAAKALASTSTRVKRVLAGFDEINRLGEKKKASSSSSRKKTTATEQTPPQEPPVKQVSPELESIDTSFLTALVSKAVGLTDVIRMVGDFKETIRQLWQEMLLPFGTWVKDTFIPGAIDYFGACFESRTQAVIIGCQRLQQGWQALQTGAMQIFQNIGIHITQLKEHFGELLTKFLLGNVQIGSSTDVMGQKIGGVVGVVVGVLTTLKNSWNTVVAGLKSSASNMAAGVVSALRSVADFLLGGFSTTWREGFAGLKNPVRGVINSILGFLNKMLSGLTGALNGVINAANRLKFTVPDWVPGIGGKSYGFSLKTVSIPQIPYLARGAVLPANQPFLAVVGDQRHGTNVEAPLATIQEAMAAVMADHTAGNMAGHEATVAVLQQILQAVLGIDVGEAVISRAAQSYRLKNAVMKGGGF